MNNTRHGFGIFVSPQHGIKYSGNWTQGAFTSSSGKIELSRPDKGEPTLIQKTVLYEGGVRKALMDGQGKTCFFYLLLSTFYFSSPSLLLLLLNTNNTSLYGLSPLFSFLCRIRFVWHTSPRLSLWIQSETLEQTLRAIPRQSARPRGQYYPHQCGHRYQQHHLFPYISYFLFLLLSPILYSHRNSIFYCFYRPSISQGWVHAKERSLHH